MIADERVIWRDPETGAQATMRETIDGDVIVTTATSTPEGAIEADRFLRMLREVFGLPS